MEDERFVLEVLTGGRAGGLADATINKDGGWCWNVISCYHITQRNGILKFYNILQESTNTY